VLAKVGPHLVEDVCDFVHQLATAAFQLPNAFAILFAERHDNGRGDPGHGLPTLELHACPLARAA